MHAQLLESPYTIAALVLLSLGAILTITGIVALIRARVGSFLLQTVTGLLLISTGSVTGLIAVGIQGYHALTREDTIAHISISPISAQKFSASFRFPDGSTSNHIIAGDEIYIDAHILKWQPIANFIGLHTAYELDRVGGRYRDIEQERSAERTLHSLRPERAVNLFELRLNNPVFSILLDAKYGSATFIPVTRTTELELKISTSGLLLRDLTPPAQ